ncbi:glycoside hydrolase family 18 protein, partial [Macrolepiota fuliginosa MF-IS2]
MAPFVAISTHTTASSPRPHILYNVQVTRDGQKSVIGRRYSEANILRPTEMLQDPFTLPPKRLLATTFIPSAWVDDILIKERKTGLANYLNSLLSTPDYEGSSVLANFFAANIAKNAVRFNPEDALPSTLSRKTAIDLITRAQGANGVEAQATAIAAAYYPDWSSGTNPPEGIDFSKFDILFFGENVAFAIPNSSSTLTWDSGSQSILQRLVSAKNASGKSTKIVLSVGGWGGSQYFSQACSSSANRTKFVNAMSSAVNQYGLDGIDIDWEYPNSTGAGNPHSASDAANLLSLFKSLRTALPKPKLLSAAVPHLPWLGTNGQPLTDVSAYAAVMDYLNIMNYDVWGASSTPGPNAPLGNLCGTSKQPQASAEAALAQWKSAGFPASQQLLGLPLYGYVSQSTKTGLTGSLMPSSDMMLLVKSEGANGKGSEPDVSFLNGVHPRTRLTHAADKEITIQSNLQSWWGQQIPFNEIVRSGALVKNSDGTYGQGGGFTMGWDDCSDTPFLYNTGQQTVVTYDDTWSLGDKAKFAHSNGMAGCFTWSLDQDDGVSLQNVIRTNLGK